MPAPDEIMMVNEAMVVSANNNPFLCSSQFLLPPSDAVSALLALVMLLVRSVLACSVCCPRLLGHTCSNALLLRSLNLLLDGHRLYCHRPWFECCAR